MKRNQTIVRRFLAVLLLMLVPAAEAAELTLRDGRPFCQAYRCDQLLPEAETFRMAAGTQLPIIEARRKGQPYAYLFLSTDLIDISGYSGKPLCQLLARKALE